MQVERERERDGAGDRIPADGTPVILAARRTPIATKGRGLAGVRAERLASTAARAVLDDLASIGIDDPVADVLLGNCTGPGGNLGRLTALDAGLGHGVPGGAVDRQCGSGLAAIADAATAIRAGDARLRLAGGAESASTAPERILDGVAYARARFTPEGMRDPGMTNAADDLAMRLGIARERSDAHARRSHERAMAASAAGRFDAELAAVGDLRADDGVGAGLRVLDRLPPLFPGGVLTAATSTRVCDGAAVVAVADAAVWRRSSIGVAGIARSTGGNGSVGSTGSTPSSDAADGRDRSAARRRAPGLAVRSYAVTGCDPDLPGIGAAEAMLEAVASAGIRLDDLAAIELVEAFAPQSIAVLERIGVRDDDERVCADGGALALGHPWGASGAVSIVRLFSRLVHGGAPAGSLGLAAASIGGGMGVAMVVEVVR